MWLTEDAGQDLAARQRRPQPALPARGGAWPTRTPDAASTTSSAPPSGPSGCSCSSTAASTAPTTPAPAGPTSPATDCRRTSASRSMVDPADPDSAYVIPLVADMDRVTPDGRVRVYETRDAGETWAARGDGLPAEHAYVTVLRQAFVAPARPNSSSSTSGRRPARSSARATPARRGRRPPAGCRPSTPSSRSTEPPRLDSPGSTHPGSPGSASQNAQSCSAPNCANGSAAEAVPSCSDMNEREDPNDGHAAWPATLGSPARTNAPQ